MIGGGWVAPSVLVTGAAGGLGLAIAGRFLDEGWEVLGWDIAGSADPRIRWSRVDVSDWDAVRLAGRSLPPLDAVVNATGVASRTGASDLEPAELLSVLSVNLVGAFALSRAVVAALEQGHGTLIHLASVGGHLGFRNRLAYDTSKAGLIHMTRHLAIEWADRGVRVLTVSPGFVNAGMAERGIASGGTDLEDVLRHSPQGRLVDVAQVASAVVRLAGPDFAAVTGSDVLVDGGFAALSGF